MRLTYIKQCQHSVGLPAQLIMIRIPFTFFEFLFPNLQIVVGKVGGGDGRDGRDGRDGHKGDK
ncbi:Hypothetical predicted protein, partial [Paramuricea clavata]